MIRRPLHRSDGNQARIISALRQAGVKVEVIGEPVDLLCGYARKLFLLEVKDGERRPSERRLRPTQQAFFNEWVGFPVYKVETISEAFNALDIPFGE